MLIWDIDVLIGFLYLLEMWKVFNSFSQLEVFETAWKPCFCSPPGEGLWIWTNATPPPVGTNGPEPYRQLWMQCSMPGHEHIEYQKKCQMECQSICQKECQNMYMPFILPDDVSENHSKTNPVGDEILVEILVWTAWYLADSTRLRPASRVQHHSGVLGAAATHAGEAGFTVGWPYPRKILFELSRNRLWYFFQISIIKLWLIWFDLIGWLIDKGRPSSHWRCNQQYSGDQDWTQDKDWTHGSSWAILRLRVLTALKSRINWKVCRRFKRQPVHLLRSRLLDRRYRS